MHYVELKFNDEDILINMERVSSVSRAKFRDGKDATLLVIGKEHYLVSSTYDEIKDKIMQLQGPIYQSPAIKKL